MRIDNSETRNPLRAIVVIPYLTKWIANALYYRTGLSGIVSGCKLRCNGPLPRAPFTLQEPRGRVIPDYKFVCIQDDQVVVSSFNG